MPNPGLQAISDRINQSLADVLALMQRFEDTGMDELMADDYLSLYDIYQRLQDQQEERRGQVSFITFKPS